MTQEHKELLLKDLCPRLPYNVIVDYGYNAFDVRKGNYVRRGSKCILTCDLLDVFMSPRQNETGEYIKPYLFPLSSMTEEQCYKFYCGFVENETDYNDFKKYYFDGCLWSKVLTSINDCSDIIDWFNKNHFDFRGLIGKGLAIDATGLNIYIEL